MSYDPRINSHDLERKVLARIIFISALVIVGYLVYDIYYKSTGISWEASTLVFSLYAMCYFLVRFSKWFIVVRRAVFAFFSLSMISGFFLLNGFNGIAVLDLANMFVLIPLLFEGKERKVMISIYFTTVVGFCFVQGFHPELILNSRVEDKPWFDVLEVLSRFLTAFNLGYTMKTEYDKEFKLVQQMNFDLKEMNEEVSSQNEEISQQREEILLINESLEDLVASRTKKIKEQNGRLVEYAFFNAHKVRGPLARILGLVNVTRLLKEKDETKEQYFNLIEESALELDEVVKEINVLLSERDKLLGPD